MIKRLLHKSINTIKKEGPKNLANKVYLFADKKLNPKKHYHAIEGTEEGYLLMVTGEPKNSTSYYRCEIPAEHMNDLGFKTDIIHYSFLNEQILDRYQHVIWYRLPLSEKLHELTKYLKQKGKKIIYSIDDLLFDIESIKSQPWANDLYPEDKNKLFRDVEGIISFMKISDLGVSSTEFLGRKMAKMVRGEVMVLHNAYSKDSLEKIEKDMQWPGSHNLGFFSGSETHDKDFEIILPALEQIMYDFPEVKVHIGGRIKYQAFEQFGDRIIRYPFMDFKDYLNALANCGVVLIPLENSDHNKAKSEVRAIQSGLVKRPVICTNTESFAYLVENQQTGLLVDNEEDWYEKIRYAVENDKQMEIMGSRLHEVLKIKYNPKVLGKQLHEFLEKYDK